MDLKKLGTPTSDKARWFNEGDASFLVASVNSKAYRDAVQEKIEENRELFRRASRRYAPAHVKKQARELRDKIALECVATLLVKDWKNVKDGTTDVPFSTAAALDLMSRYESFADLIADMATADADDEAEALAEGVDNLKNG